MDLGQAKSCQAPQEEDALLYAKTVGTVEPEIGRKIQFPVWVHLNRPLETFYAPSLKYQVSEQGQRHFSAFLWISRSR